ncbi:hypothetical protein CC86DRAFT_86198 [Ophiobolus disseminans]|uniref:DUF7708 domain-containing protein n=1 Tax=Ophiobolus disseminans TaxID=1469910 RepID=A0A6A7AHF4_9PLEO|nr:hypothetical protein CC86DRAFT_86198 [Ophiobolus disseminans]
MKFLFIVSRLVQVFGFGAHFLQVVENHEKQVKTLAKGLTHIADVLPHIELANTLYPTARMQQAVTQIYSKLIQFFLQAERWYRQSKVRHAWESLGRPVELYWGDLIVDVEECTMQVENLANVEAHAKQRDMHLEIQVLSERVNSSEAMLREMRGHWS